MEKATDATGALTSSDSSPRSTLGWHDDWGYESGSLSPTNSKPLVGLPSVLPDGPETPPPQLEKRTFRSLWPSLSFDRRARNKGGTPVPESRCSLDGPVSPVRSKQPCCNNAPPSPTLGVFQLGKGDPHLQAQGSELWDLTWPQDRPAEDSTLPPFSPATSGGRLSARGDEPSVGSAREGTTWRNAPLTHRMHFASLLNDDLNSIKTCVKRAIDTGVRVQHYNSLEVSELRAEKATAEEAVQKSLEWNRVLERQASALLGELQTLEWERELDVLAMSTEIQELETERDSLMKAAQEERMKRETLQSEVDSVLSVLLEEKMRLESHREAHDVALRNERKKVQKMKKERDDAVRALQEGTQKLELERDAVLTALRDLTSRLDFEREADLRSMRRTSMDMAMKMSDLRCSGNRKNQYR